MVYDTSTRTPLVSVVIAAYNMPDYLNQAIESVQSQTFREYEIIVVDDCSPEESVRRYRLPNGTRLIRRSERYGAAAATRNTGIAEARGRYIAFLDQDDVWLPDKLDMQVAVLESNPDAGLAFCHCIAVDEHLNPLPTKWRRRSHLRHGLRKLIRGCFIRTPSAVLVRRSVLHDCGLFDESVFGASDWDLWLRVARNSELIAIPDSLVLYRMHREQLHKRREMMDRAKLRIYEKTLEWALHERPDLESVVRRYYCRVLRQIAAHRLMEGGDPFEGMRAVRQAISMWPWSPQTYGLLVKAFIRSYPDALRNR